MARNGWRPGSSGVGLMVETDWDPYDYPDPVAELTLRIRGLSVGQAIGLTNGSMVKSVTVRHGATHVRRFAVGRPGKGGMNPTYRTAAQAADAALGKGGKK